MFAYFLHHVEGGFRVLEQVRGHIQVRDVIGAEGSGYFHDPRAYSVIMKWKGNPNEIRLSTGHVMPPIQ